MMEDRGVDEDHAAMKVLGVSYNELGIGIAKTWNFPDRLIAGMQKIKGNKVTMPSGDVGRMRVTVNMANELCSIATVSDPKGKKEALRNIRERYAGKELDIVIEDVGAPNIASKIPPWHSKAVDAKYFLLLPVVVNKIAVGLIYADMQDAKTMQITPRQLSMLRTLRNQAVLAIKQMT